MLIFLTFKRKEIKGSPVVNQTAGQVDSAGIGRTFANTSGFFNNAVVGQAVDDRRSSWLQRLRFGRKSVNPGKEECEQTVGVSRKKKLRRFSTKRNSTQIEGTA